MLLQMNVSLIVFRHTSVRKRLVAKWHGLRRTDVWGYTLEVRLIRKEEAGRPSKGILMSREHQFEIIEHTADFGVVGKGPTMADAFESAAYGMFTIVADLDKYQPTTQKEITAAGTDDVNLLERFLSSLLVAFNRDGLLPLDFEITEISMGRLTCWIDVRPVADDIKWLGPKIKAVTHHQIVVENKGGEWLARAIFDV